MSPMEPTTLGNRTAALANDDGRDTAAVVDAVSKQERTTHKSHRVKNSFNYPSSDCGAVEPRFAELAEAATAGDHTRVRQLLALRTPVNDYSPVLLSAVKLGHGAVVAELLWAGASANSSNSHGWTALHAAARRGSAALVRLLLSRGAAVNVKDKYARTPLHAAVLSQHGEAAQALLAAGAAPSWACGTLKNNTALHMAAARGMTATVQALIQAGASLNCRNSEGCTALHEAARGGYTGVVQALLDAGASMVPCDSGFTPLFVATAVGSLECIKLIAAAAPDTVNAVTDKGTSGVQNSVLQLATVRGDVDVIEALLEAGADVMLAVNGMSALELAATAGYADVVDCFARHCHEQHHAAHMTEVAVLSAVQCQHDVSLETQQQVVSTLLRSAAQISRTTALETIKQNVSPPVNFLVQSFMDAWLQAAAVVADVGRERAAVQQLLITTATAHRAEEQRLAAQQQALEQREEGVMVREWQQLRLKSELWQLWQQQQVPKTSAWGWAGSVAGVALCGAVAASVLLCCRK